MGGYVMPQSSSLSTYAIIGSCNIYKINKFLDKYEINFIGKCFIDSNFNEVRYRKRIDIIAVISNKSRSFMYVSNKKNIIKGFKYLI